MVVHRNFIWTMHRFVDHIIQYRFGTINPQSVVNVNRPTGLQVTYTAGPIHAHPSQLASFYRSPSSTRYRKLCEVMKVHVSNIPIPINAEITRRIKVQDVFHLKASVKPDHSRYQIKTNIILIELCYLSFTFTFTCIWSPQLVQCKYWMLGRLSVQIPLLHEATDMETVLRSYISLLS